MRKIIRVEQKTSTPDAAGEAQFSWSLVCQRHAAVDRANGRELFSANQRSARVPSVFVTRFPRDLTVLPQMRLTCDGILYDILSAYDPDGYRDILRIVCEQLVNEPVDGT